MERMRISIFGLGYVGAVSGACLAKLGHEVLGIDKNPLKVERMRAGQSPIVEEGIQELCTAMHGKGRLRATTEIDEAIGETELSLVSVGTPSAKDGSLSLDAIVGVTDEIGQALRAKDGPHVVVYRSTVLPGTCEEVLIPRLEKSSGRSLGDGLEVLFNPEFLREGSSIRDFGDPPFTISGARSDDGHRWTRELYRGIEAELVETSIRCAESVKYLSNMYHALKVAFANEAGSVLARAGVDSREAFEIFFKDETLNISDAYLRPGNAFGGSCLPKDLRAFLALASRENVDTPLLRNVLPGNRAHLDRVFEAIEDCGKGKVALLGLAFKGGTDDLRESPMVTLAEKLIGRGFELSIHDPNVQTAKLVGANKTFIEQEIPHVDRLLAKDLDAALDGASTVVVANLAKEERGALCAWLEQRGDAAPQVLDLIGIEDLSRVAGPRYRGIAW